MGKTRKSDNWTPEGKMTEEVVAGTIDGTSDEAAARAEAVRRNGL